MSKRPPFLSLPSGIDLAHHFWEETDRRNPGCDGIDLWRDGSDYCYLWVTAMIDHDMFHSYLLDIRTSRAGQETRDFLFVHVGVQSTFDVEWYQHPTTFEEDSHERTRAGLLWLIDRDEASMESHG